MPGGRARRDERDMTAVATPLEKHFVIGRKPLRAPARWQRLFLQDIEIAHGPNLPVHPIVHPVHGIQGYLLGWLVGSRGLLEAGTELEGPDQSQTFADWSAELCGRFVCLLHGDQGMHLHTDPSGLLAAVYSTGGQAVASIPQLLGNIVPDRELQTLIDVPRQFGWYPFGLTPFRNVRRLLPNHALDLDRFETRRFHGTGTDLPAAGKEDLVSGILDRVADNLHRLCRGDQTVMHMTAGCDSRMVLGAALAAGCRPVLTTISLPSGGAQVDCLTAAKLARQCGLRHEVRPFLPPTEEDRQEWLERTGCCVCDHVTNLSTTLKSWAHRELQVTGTCGEIGRAYYWGASDLEADAPDATEILSRIKVPVASPIVEAAEAWLDRLHGLPAVRIWDLVYVEQRLGCWAGPSVYGSKLLFPSMSPFNSRTIIDAMLRLPAAYRLENRFAREFIGRGDPNLLQIPFNRPTGIHIFRYPQMYLKGKIPAPMKRALLRVRANLR